MLKESYLYFVPLKEIRRVRKRVSDCFLSCEILADIFRLNSIYMVMRAGSGHLGTCLSSIDIVTWLWTQEMRSPNEPKSKNSDTYFSSKGHDVPALYSLLIGLEKIDFNYIHKLRRLGGLPGHPDIVIPYIAANTGSLGMGISKARGLALASRLSGRKGRIFVMTGDGELQEGQIWESLQPAVNGKFSEITVIIDHNKMQAVGLVSVVSPLGKLEEKFRSFGWEVARCDGHDFRALAKVFSHFRKIKNRPQVLIANTVKGKGVSFMESTLPQNKKHYKYHSGALSPEEYILAANELANRINQKLQKRGLKPLKFESVEMPQPIPPKNPERPVEAFGDELIKIANKRKDIVVLDADLLPDSGLTLFKEKFPARFFECGIAEQDMVSLASGLALQGKLPIVHSFACFLSARPNEQIYNNASEDKKIIYVGTLAGLIPGGPGHSHQSVRDISALGSVPGLTMIQPCNEQEARMAIRWAVEKNKESTYLRFVSVPLELPYQLPKGYQLKEGQGTFLTRGKDVAIIAYGTTMLKQAFEAAQKLNQRQISTAVINFPWLNRVDEKWLKNLLKFKLILTLDDHYIDLGQGTMIASAIAKNFSRHPKVISLGLKEIPACGANDEVLKHHHLNSESIVKKVTENLKNI